MDKRYTILLTLFLLATIPPPNYPSSMDIMFKWVQNNNTQQVIQLKASGGLDTDAVAGGRDKIYIHRWKLPSCKFFRRYLPTDWTFSLVFDPHYPETTSNNITSPVHALAPMGPKQSAITIPVSISFNITAMDNKHIKGC